jgi:ATP adenylyltransferase
MDRLWSPWRLAYVTAAQKSSDDCIFCAAAAEPNAPLVLHRGRHGFIILNLYPYNNGHLMVAPNRHINTLASLLPEEQAELMVMARWSEMALTQAYHPQGINVGINLGKAAGAGIEDHLHVHLVPRWAGDTNFMTAVAGTRVLPEGLEDTATRLRPIFAMLANANA